jgi:hypothetical protein
MSELKEKQLLNVIQSLQRVLEMVKGYTPEDIQNLINQHIETTKSLTNEITSSN